MCLSWIHCWSISLGDPRVNFRRVQEGSHFSLFMKNILYHLDHWGDTFQGFFTAFQYPCWDGLIRAVHFKHSFMLISVLALQQLQPFSFSFLTIFSSFIFLSFTSWYWEEIFGLSWTELMLFRVQSLPNIVKASATKLCTQMCGETFCVNWPISMVNPQ